MDVNLLNEICRNTMVSNLGIEFIYFDEESIHASMPVDSRTMQPMGYLHGGASIALAETLASAGSVAILNNKMAVFGISISAQHINSVREGSVIGKAKIVKMGKMLHTWEVKIFSGDILVSKISAVNAVIEKKD
jgi:1,4-dihydroxy-2-naphthoyl-CoA hydrolase